MGVIHQRGIEPGYALCGSHDPGGTLSGSPYINCADCLDALTRRGRVLYDDVELARDRTDPHVVPPPAGSGQQTGDQEKAWSTYRYSGQVQRHHPETRTHGVFDDHRIVNLEAPCRDLSCQLEHLVVLQEQWYRDLLKEARAFRKIRKFFALYGEPIGRLIQGAERKPRDQVV